MSPDPFAVTITGQDIYREVVRLTGQMEVLIALQQEDRKDVQDHETRIRGLERGRWPLPSLAALLAIASAVIAAVALFAK